MKLLFRCFVMLLLLHGYAGAQQKRQARIDSMIASVANSDDDTGKIATLNAIAYEYNKISPYDGIRFGTQTLALAEKLKWQKGIGRANSALGANYFSLSDYPNATKHWLIALHINEQMDFKLGIANHLHNIGNIYSSQKEYTTALNYYERALKAYEDIGDKRLATNSFSAIGNVYAQMKEYPKALEYHYMALSIDQSLNDENAISTDMADIGAVYNEQGNYARALDMLLHAVQVKKETTDNNGLARGYYMTGSVYLAIARYLAQHADTAKQYGTAAASIKAATTYLDSAVAISTSIGYLDNLQKSYQLLAEVYDMSGDYKNALAFTRMHRMMRDSVFSQENTANIVKQASKFEYEKIRMQDMQASATKLQRQRTYTYTGIAGIVVLIGISLVVARNNRTQRGLNNTINKLVSEQAETIQVRTQELADSNTQLANSNKKLIELIQYNSHNIREPLTRVMGGMSLRELIPEEEFNTEVWPEIERSVSDLDNSIKKAIVTAEDAVKMYG